MSRKSKERERKAKAAMYRFDQEMERRRKVEVWYPTAADLPLVDIPEDVRPHLRKRLAPWLLNLKSFWRDHYRPLGGVRGGNCWETAQSLVRTANDPDVTLVEGVWIRPWELEEGQTPVPHTWAKVDGHRVDLIGEFYAWSGDEEWLYEPLREYTCTEVAAFNNAEDFEPGNPISEWRVVADEMGKLNEEIEAQLPAHLKWEQEPQYKTQVQPPSEKYPNGLWGTPEEIAAYDRFKDERDKYIGSIIFKPAVDRLLQRHASKAKATAA